MILDGRVPRSARLRLAVAVPVLLVLAACGGSAHPSQSSTPPAPPVQHKEISFGGQTRTYRLFTPSTLDRSHPAPLVVVLGGYGNTAESMVGATDFDRMASTGDFLVAYPDGVNDTWNAGYCCLGRAASGPDDVGFLGRVIDDVEAAQKIDQGRVYMVGVSAGAMMGYRMGCEVADRIAGVGSVAGAMVLDSCHPSKPVSVIEIHGTADGEVPYGGGHTAGGATQDSPPTAAVVGRWAELDQCPPPAAPQTQGPVTMTAWTGCADGTAVKLLSIDGGGHTWFATGLGPVAGSVDATSAIWGFFSSLPARR